MSKKTTNLLLMIASATLIVAAVLGILNLVTTMFNTHTWVSTLVYILFIAAVVIYAIVFVLSYLNKRNSNRK